MCDKLILLWTIITISILYLIKSYSEGYVSYANPWQNDKGYPWNWYRRWWNRGKWDSTVHPRCPQGCIYTGYISKNPNGYSCGNRGLKYGKWNCQYDYQCSRCRIEMDEMGEK